MKSSNTGRRFTSAAVATGAALLFAASAHAQIDPFRAAFGQATTGIFQTAADGSRIEVGEIFVEVGGLTAGVQHWVYFPDYAPERPMSLLPSGASYPGVGEFLNATRQRGVKYLAVPPDGRRFSADTVCTTFARGAAGSVQDALIREAEPEKNFGASGSLTASSGAASTVRHGLLRFDVSSIPHGSLVVSADLSLTALLQSGGTHVHAVQTPWDEATVTWGLFSRQGERLGAGPAGAFLRSVEANVSFAQGGGVGSTGLRALAQGWIDGSVPNFGVLLERDREEGIIVYASSESPTVAARPQLRICYQPAIEACAAGCPADQVCAAGACRLPDEGQTCYGVPDTCPNDCSGNGVCDRGTCFCQAGFTGADCSQPIDVCPNDCSGNGICRFGVCFCSAGFAGADCGTPQR